jgi:anti-anti-sigma factor
MTALRVFETQQLDDTLILAPSRDLSELHLSRFEEETSAVLELLASLPVKHVVLDFAKTDYYGSTALGFFVKLWTRLRQGGGQMAFCNISENELEILRLTKLDSLWPVCGTREEAIEAVRSNPTTDPPPETPAGE